MALPLLRSVSDLFSWLKSKVVEMGRWQICPLLLGIFLAGKPNETDVDLQVETSEFGEQINAIFN